MDKKEKLLYIFELWHEDAEQQPRYPAGDGRQEGR